jgi:hypothetical protein
VNALRRDDSAVCGPAVGSRANARRLPPRSTAAAET